MKPKWIFAVFPHAGGWGQNFLKLKAYLPPEVEFVSFDYRGIKSETVQDLAARLLENLRPLFIPPENHVVFLGYSLGGLVAYEVASRLMEEGRQPELLITAAMVPPQLQALRPDSEKFHFLDDRLFLERMEKEAGVSQAPFLDPGFRRAFLPALRREVEMAEKYRYQKRENPLSCRIVSLYGRQDKIVFGPGPRPAEFEKRLGDWGQLTQGPFALYWMEGGHFFLLDRPEEGMGVILQAAGFPP